jgi:hypothetical protein
MEFFTAMLIVYTLRDVQFEAEIYYETERKCGDALMDGSNFFKTIYKSERDTLIRCIPTDIPSTSPSPKLRPKR